jgi:hypothetical protein
LKLIRVKRKPRKCPQCGSTKIADILHGMPDYSPDLEKRIEDGRIALGGCCISNDDPKWKCTECELDIYKEAKM